MLKYSGKGNNCVFALFQETSNAQCIYLPFKDLEISKKKRLRIVRKLKAMYERCFSKLKCNKTGAADAIKS